MADDTKLTQFKLSADYRESKLLNTSRTVTKKKKNVRM